MQITFIFHSGFAVECEQCILVFDFWMDPANVMASILKSDKPIYVFASHFHEDHFTKAVFKWREKCGNITYLLSKDILKHHRAEKTDADAWLAKGATWQDANITVFATGSNDSGVSWIVEVGGSRIFHAGDLGNWYARFLTSAYQGEDIYSVELGEMVNPGKEEKRYLGELKDIAKVASSFHVAFLPVDGRIGNGYTLSARQFIEKFGVGLLVPMHFTASGFQSAWRIEDYTVAANVGLWKIERVGQMLEIR